MINGLFYLGSKNRKTLFSGNVVNSKEEKSIKIRLNSPIYNLHGETAYRNNAQEVIFLIKSENILNNSIFFKIGFSIDNKYGKRSVLRPILEYNHRETQNKIKVDGQVIREINGSSIRCTLDGFKVIIKYCL